MTAMPQMVAIFNGMGGGAAAAIAAVGAARQPLRPHDLADSRLAGAVIGSVSIAGSMIAFLKLQGWLPSKAIVYPLQQPTNIAVLVFGVGFGLYSVVSGLTFWLLPFYAFLLLFGILMALPIGGADMPVVISLFNALTGIAVALDGFALVNGPLGDAGYAMVIAGTLVGAAGSLLTLLMAKAMNRQRGERPVRSLRRGRGDRRRP